MKKFLVQVEEDGSPSYDFCFGMMVAERYFKWSHNRENLDIILSQTGDKKLENPNDYIPVGSVEFVEDFVKANYGENAVRELKPMYPEFFNDFYLGDMKLGNAYKAAEAISKDPSAALHVKSATRIKDENNGSYGPSYILGMKDIYNKDNGWYVGSCIYPKSEWRVFVNDGIILGIKNYNGSPWILPNEEVVKRLVDGYCESIKYKTEESNTFVLDVGVSPIDGATKVVEIHEFYSCGLYGFDLYERLPYMFSKQWFHILNRIKKV